ncbi:type IV pili methyl-accepting chemotaxis transducer N-terminal domain-containing protein [Atopomonas sediminilitoris]|uniref:type IV pili methyl-accepting chemotaxis transducer N-terminal domain-containing protein n=1 Tax=Atopomonas sediminilitoris TaxID=2919919 RepID=UPI001F4D9925|nr:type IV pili methyl-accepting chemotaxis transducer N-terminal domain-containing protein [Atopomonas sediminilitoris]MCJ8170823.1 type IV pili methyl-accepting chemotaxis transducer N-terminal domain-containing protein [Atopomonas sediminilitoris]
MPRFAKSITLPFLALLTALLFSLSSQANPAAATNADAEAVNRAGQQRMLSQRISKNYLMLGQDIRPDVANRQLDDSLARFEENHSWLSQYAKTDASRAALKRSDELWQQFRSAALQAPSKAQAPALIELSEALLAASENTVKQIEQDTGLASAALINQSGRQRMLSQRIALFYMALSWKLPDPSLAERFNQAVSEFDQSLQQLQQAPQNNPEISQLLHKADAQWQFSRKGFALSNDARFVPTLISTTSESLLGNMEQLTQAYTRLQQS